MQFSCQRTGICCTHPNIVITLTHEDLWTLYEETRDIDELQQIIQFLIPNPDNSAEKLVLQTIQTTNGKGLFILRKNKQHQCIFYNVKEKSCQIHTLRPQACRNFPFAFTKINDQIHISLVKGANTFCEGIGKGKDYSQKELKKIGVNSLEVLKQYNNIINEINREALEEQPLTPQEALITILVVAEKNKEKFTEKLEIL